MEEIGYIMDKNDIKAGTLIVKTIEDIDKNDFCKIANKITNRCIAINKINLDYCQKTIEFEVVAGKGITNINDKLIQTIVWRN